MTVEGKLDSLNKKLELIEERLKKLEDKTDGKS